MTSFDAPCRECNTENISWQVADGLEVELVKCFMSSHSTA